MSRLLLLVVACCIWLAACIPPTSTSLSTRIVAPGGVSPLLDSAHVETLMARLPTRSGKLAGEGGVPIFWRALDPGNYQLDYRYTGNPDGTAMQQVAFDVGFAKPTAAPAPRGTVVLLHGWMMDGDSLMPWALQLAQAGYRTISLDLRNHGRSGTGPAGYGTREGEDVARVVGELRARGEIAGPLYLFGVSYGAATAIFAAHDLGDQVTGVVAMESFANAGRGIRDMVPHMLASRPDTWKTAATTLIAQATYGRQNLDAVIAAADAQLKLNLDDVDVAGALRDTPACVLIVHGRNDHHIPVAHGRMLAAAAPRDAYLEVPGETHLSLPMRLDRLAPTVDDWFRETANTGTRCPTPQPLMPVAPAALVASAH
ncbi:Lysophospholipase, alpha-beta hydrolase superfamily [Pseudoxanthomonas sp. GM95]|uniref:alpha/beta hydrolase n=1 Tax=Pseudoxanthomonas sp. GM95 TaxID=1881043 RepID=UPI0008BFBB4A|nr:alpha/beta fold hydrolase [Pseudoxanthomonas sp. GM95]SEL50507.1 Lysophospholipase, alpha-beta hydrolase superfamily [Pseudoxanthomonas sp. GM95]